jgi:aspartate aminotransferase
MTALQSLTTHNAAAGSQHGALAALTDLDAADAAVHAMVAEFHARRDAVVREVRQEPGLAFVEPAGAFYLYMNVAGAVRDSADAGTAFAKQLLERHDVAIVPGAAFLTPEWVRMSYAAPMDQVVTGARRIVQAFRELRG